MIVVTVTDCPPRLRGDLSKWLIEINTGVYVGHVNTRVREEIWKRVCEHLPNGRATMVYTAANEQRMAFHVHNTTWQPTDYDGLTLMLRPAPSSAGVIHEHRTTPASKAGIQQQLQRIESARARHSEQAGYAAIDIETTGLNSAEDDIIELAAVRIAAHKVAATFTTLVRPARTITADITELTGITQAQVNAEGKPLSEAMAEFCAFIGGGPIVSHNLSFDLEFLNAACRRLGLAELRNHGRDTLSMSRRLVDDADDYKLSTMAAYFGIPTETSHRALPDCITTYHLYEKLNEY